MTKEQSKTEKVFNRVVKTVNQYLRLKNLIIGLIGILGSKITDLILNLDLEDEYIDIWKGDVALLIFLIILFIVFSIMALAVYLYEMKLDTVNNDITLQKNLSERQTLKDLVVNHNIKMKEGIADLIMITKEAKELIEAVEGVDVPAPDFTTSDLKTAIDTIENNEKVIKL